jgi:N-acetylglucosamine-6-sulfatase
MFRARGALLVVLGCSAVILVVGCSGSEPSQEEGAEAPTHPGTTQQVEEAQPPTDRPNIIFVLTDDLDYASAYKMPEIDSLLLEEGASFEEAFVSHAQCCPSRTTILTGLYDHNHGVRSNNPPNGGFEKFLAQGHEENTIAVRLQEGGYRTAFFGKYLNGYPGDDPTHVPPGWDEWYGKLKTQKLYRYDINENGKVVSYGRKTEDFYTDVLAGQATDFIRRRSSDPKPFFMYVAPTAPHAPATPAERHKGAFANEEAPRPPSFDEEDVSDKPSWIRDTARLSDEEVSGIDDRYRERLESMLAVDDMVASLVRELEAAGKLDDTYIFFTSDNGYQQGEHRLKKGKGLPYEESVRVPLFVRGPGVPAGSRIEKLVLNTDFAPTFADLGGTEFPADGRSFKPLLGGEVPPSWRSAFLLETLGGQEESTEEGDTEEGDTEEKSGGVPSFEGARTETHKYVEYENGKNELYDLEPLATQLGHFGIMR